MATDNSTTAAGGAALPRNNSDEFDHRGAILVEADHEPITIVVETLSKEMFEAHCYRQSAVGAVYVAYQGHKADLAAAGCLPLGLCAYDRLMEDDTGGLWRVSRDRRRPVKRGFIKVQYYATNRAFAASLPGVSALHPEALARLPGRPHLRLVVDNTR